MSQHTDQPTLTPAGPVTRVEIADAVDAAFAGGPATRDDLVAVATSARARPALLDVLLGLPPVRYESLRSLWVHLPDLPVD